MPVPKPDIQKIKDTAVKAKDTAVRAKDAVADKIEEINVEEIIAQAMKLPGAKIDRAAYLGKQLRKYYPDTMVADAIRTTPAQAGITKEGIENLAKNTIKYETSKVTAVSAVAGIPGGFAMLGTIPADTAQYFVFAIRVAQKLAYLYGYPDMGTGNEPFDDGSMYEILCFIGSMFGVKEANVGIKIIAEALKNSLPKKIARKALMKGAIYPIVKSIAKNLEMEMTKEIFAKGVGKTIPIVGGVVSGGLTYTTFRIGCYRLQKELEKNFISDVEYKDWV